MPIFYCWAWCFTVHEIPFGLFKPAVLAVSPAVCASPRLLPGWAVRKERLHQPKHGYVSSALVPGKEPLQTGCWTVVTTIAAWHNTAMGTGAAQPWAPAIFLGAGTGWGWPRHGPWVAPACRAMAGQGCNGIVEWDTGNGINESQGWRCPQDTDNQVQSVAKIQVWSV